MRFNMEVIWRALLFYFKYPVSLRQVEELLFDRGVKVCHTSIYNWVLKFGPEFEKKFRKIKMPVSRSWKLDETYVKVKGQWKYLYRAVDRYGQTIDFLLTARRNKKAAKRFLKKAIKNNGQPIKINIDKSGANTAGINSLNNESSIKIKMTRVKFLNNLVEQDHRYIKDRIRLMKGFKEFHSAKIIIAGIEIMNMISKRQSGLMPLFFKNSIETYWAIVSL